MTPSPSTSTDTKVVSAWALPSASAVAALELSETTETSARPVFSCPSGSGVSSATGASLSAGVSSAAGSVTSGVGVASFPLSPSWTMIVV